RYAGPELEARRVGVDQELARDRRARGVEPPSDDAVARTVLIPAVPDHDEIARRVHADARIELCIPRRGVDLELSALTRARGVELLAEDSGAGSVLAEAGPDDDELAGGIDGHAGGDLVPGRVGVDLKLGNEGRRLRLRKRGDQRNKGRRGDFPEQPDLPGYAGESYPLGEGKGAKLAIWAGAVLTGRTGAGKRT